MSGRVPWAPPEPKAPRGPAHSEQNVYAHKGGSPLVYGLEMTPTGTTGAPAAS